MMARLPATRGGLATPKGSLQDLRAVIEELSTRFQLNIGCEDSELEDLWYQFGHVCASFEKEVTRPTTKAVNTCLDKINKASTDIIGLLIIERGGLVDLRPARQEAFSRLKEALALSPLLRSRESASQ